MAPPLAPESLSTGAGQLRSPGVPGFSGFLGSRGSRGAETPAGIARGWGLLANRPTFPVVIRPMGGPPLALNTVNPAVALT